MISINSSRITTVLDEIECALMDDGGVYVRAYPDGTIASKPKTDPTNSECILFVDGLRLDLGKRLSAQLEKAGLEVTETSAWSALPSVAATARWRKGD